MAAKRKPKRTLKENVMALLQPRPEEPSVIAESSSGVDKASLAFIAHAGTKNWADSIDIWLKHLNGRVRKLEWVKLPKGVTEIIVVMFSDLTGVRMSRFVNASDNSVSVTIKRIEEN
jgi:hypothetical protein